MGRGSSVSQEFRCLTAFPDKDAPAQRLSIPIEEPTGVVTWQRREDGSLLIVSFGVESLDAFAALGKLLGVVEEYQEEEPAELVVRASALVLALGIPLVYPPDPPPPPPALVGHAVGNVGPSCAIPHPEGTRPDWRP